MAEIRTILIKPETENMNALKDTLHTQQDTLLTQQSLLQKLYNELDEERESSATAASEALSMILRLQGQKAAVEMEANQYKRMSEEKIFHVEETLSVFEDLMYKKEMEIAALEFQVQAYRCKLLSMGCSDLGVFEAKFLPSSENFPLQKSETCNRDMGISETGRRNNSLPPISLKDVYLKLGVVDRERSTSPMSNIIPKTSEGSTDKYLELSSENSVGGNFDSYWEQIKKLDERVKEMSSCNLGIVKGEPISCSLSSIVSYDKKVGHHQNLLKTESTISTSPSRVQDIFEVPQIHHDRKSYGKRKKDNVDWILENDNRLEKPHIVDEDEKGCASNTNTLQCANIEKLISSIAYEFEMKQLATRMDRIENERRNVRHEISDHEGEDGIKLLLKEMREQLNSIQSDMRNLRKTKKYAAPDDPGVRSLKEAMLCFWL